MGPAKRTSNLNADSDVLTDDEAELWAEREKKRRKAWLDGPSEEEKREWLESRRRSERDSSTDSEDIDEGRRIANRWQRDIGWALTGLASRLIDYRYGVLGNLVREGREWEEEYRAARRRRRRAFSEEEEI
jgi:hypothetical protein